MFAWLPTETGCSSTSSWFFSMFKFLLLQVLQFLRIIPCVKYIAVVIINKVRILDTPNQYFWVNLCL